VKLIAMKVIHEDRAPYDGTTPTNIQNTTSMAGMRDRSLQRASVTTFDANSCFTIGDARDSGHNARPKSRTSSRVAQTEKRRPGIISLVGEARNVGVMIDEQPSTIQKLIGNAEGDLPLFSKLCKTSSDGSADALRFGRYISDIAVGLLGACSPKR
jgi:hypothetical protein